MLKRIIACAILLWYCGAIIPAYSQQSNDCNPASNGGPAYTGEVNFNFGSATNAVSLRNRSSYTIGQPAVGNGVSSVYVTQMGFWSRFLIPPLAPVVIASQGELLDRIQVSWSPNPIGARATEGFKLYRDGVFLALVDDKTYNYNDFNVIAGRAYNYSVRGLNQYGEGEGGSAIGFQVPNGVVTGWIQTVNGSPVPDALVTLMPMQGFSALFGAADGAMASLDSNQSFLPTANADWSIAFWIKTSAASADAGILELGGFPLYINAFDSGSGEEGISVSDGSGELLSAAFPDSSKNDWHHVTLTYGQEYGRLYVDGVLADIGPMSPIPAATDLMLGASTSNNGWFGRLDELRFYHRRLDEIDLGEVMEGTASSTTPDLKYYWKMDEERGIKSFDVLNRIKLLFCGVKFDTDRPPVRTSGKTNEQGYYRIESASYGTGLTFLAEPTKLFYMHRALKFVRDHQDYALLPDFSLTAKSTLELWVNSAGPDNEQCILSKIWDGNDFRLKLSGVGATNELKFYLNGTENNLGTLGSGYQHLAFTIDSSGSDRVIQTYKNGHLYSTNVFPNVSGNWSDTLQQWVVGARKDGVGYGDFYGGLVDEIAVYDTILDSIQIIKHFLKERDPQASGLRVYFALDEGNGIRLNNGGALLTGYGSVEGATWTPFSPNQQTEPHEFTPKTRQVTLNPSVTSVDQVDFIDRSTVSVSGFVRYKNTDCFAEKIEILVNGASYHPAIFTDSTGKFLIDLDPGATVTLTPKFEDHNFTPAFWDVTNVSSPIAGILFTDMTTRKVTGQVAGGKCKLPIISDPNSPSGTVCRVTVRSKDGCLERSITIKNEDGDFVFNGLPPIEYTIAVTEHSDPAIKSVFQTNGGSSIDLTKRDTTIDFIYFAPPQVDITKLDSFSTTCPIIVLDQGETKTLTIKVFEEYVPGGRCYLDTADIHIINGFAEEVKDTAMSGKFLKYKFTVGNPNPSKPFTKTLQVVAKTLSKQEASAFKEAVITGIKKKNNTFTTQLPQTPILILRDPPGDGSYSYFEKDSTICSSYSVFKEYENGVNTETTGDVGPDIKIIAAPLGAGMILETGSVIGGALGFNYVSNVTSDSSFEVCMTFHESISTSEDELVVGAQGGDVFVGGGLNVEYGNADEVIFNPDSCIAKLRISTIVSPKNFGTTYMYTAWHIKNVVIPNLQDLANSAINGSPEKARYIQSIDQWNKILADNETQKSLAKFSRNISFASGVSYEYAITSDSSASYEHAHADIFEFNTGVFAGFDVAGVGVETDIRFVHNENNGKTDGTGFQSGITTGYVLADNDPGDAISVDVGMDNVYKTPVFTTKVGRTSCPWEPNTAHRDGPSLEPVGLTELLNIPANEPAVFKFNLGNESETNERRVYAFSAGPESNPYGAVIKLNGAPLNNTIFYDIPPNGASIPITLTVERGPVEYNYDNLEITLSSDCEDGRAEQLGIDPPLASSKNITVHFERPCSEVAVNVPEQNWVINNEVTNTSAPEIMRITASGYDKSSPDFKSIKVQYRKTNGDGAWINIDAPNDPVIQAVQSNGEILKANLGATFTQFYWDSEGLQDGLYEIHAIAICDGSAGLNPGYSQIIQGRIDREPPSLISVPEPSDGVLNLGDEISFTFNKEINCNKLIPADQFNANNVALRDVSTNQLVDIQFTCYENKITINIAPGVNNKTIENHILRAELHDIEDLTGNKSSFFKWEFYVNRNELGWLTDSLGMTKYLEQTKTMSAGIQNRGGSPVSFSIQNVPAWVHVVPNQGTLAPNEIRQISFTADSTLAFGMWTDSIILRTETGQNPFFMGGDEPLPIGVRVLCRPPGWDLTAGLYENTMNLVLQVKIQTVISTDPEDIVGAFINGELRGRANVQYVPELDSYLAYLTVYGDINDNLDPVMLQIWDASECILYGTIQENFTFQADNVIGIPTAPQVIHTNSLVLRDVPLRFGWNWLSFNLAFPNSNINSALASLNQPENDLMKSQTQFSTYSNGWFGSLTTLNNTGMYIYKADIPDTLQMLGDLIDPAMTHIPLVPGWNWVSYVPNYALPINEALSSVPAQPGDLIKSQVAFAQYINGLYGWIGNLKYMDAPNGYQIKVSSAGTLTYPPPALTGNPTAARGIPVSAFWNVNAAQYENNSTLIGMLRVNDQNATSATMELGAFVGDEIRGSAQAVYIEPLNSYLFFLTTYANIGGELMHFKLFDAATGNVQPLIESMYFVQDNHQGSISQPVPFSLQTTGSQEPQVMQSFEIQPNPFSTETAFRFGLPHPEEILLTITDMSGQEVSRLQTQAREGLNVVHWDGKSDTGTLLHAGVYFVSLKTAQGIVTRKVVLQR